MSTKNPSTKNESRPRQTPKTQERKKPQSEYEKQHNEKARLRSRRTHDPTFHLRKSSYDKHRERVNEVKCVVDSKCPEVCKNKYSSQTRFNRSLDKFCKIERENAIMLSRISHIMQGPATVDTHLDTSTKKVGALARTRQMKMLHITFDNLHMLKRIQEQKPTYDRKKQLADYNRYEEKMKKMSYFPLFWKVQKPSDWKDYEEDARNKAENEPHPRVFLDFGTDKEEGRIVITLRADIVPLTAENFRTLCTGESGVSYRCSSLHRIVPDLLWQGGDINEVDGKGNNKPRYGQGCYPDENFILKHNGPGVVSMANYGPNTNRSQFIITACKLPSLDNVNVVIGKVTTGMDVLTKLCDYVSKASDKPKKAIYITKCGQLLDFSDSESDEGDKPETETETEKTQKQKPRKKSKTSSTEAVKSSNSDPQSKPNSEDQKSSEALDDTETGSEFEAPSSSDAPPETEE